jgi:hypothetical protein
VYNCTAADPTPAIDAVEAALDQALAANASNCLDASIAAMNANRQASRERGLQSDKKIEHFGLGLALYQLTLVWV